MKMCMAICAFPVMTVHGQRVLTEGNGIPADQEWLMND